MNHEMRVAIEYEYAKYAWPTNHPFILEPSYLRYNSRSVRIFEDIPDDQIEIRAKNAVRTLARICGVRKKESSDEKTNPMGAKKTSRRSAYLHTL